MRDAERVSERDLRGCDEQVVAGALVPLGVVVLSIPSSVFGGENPNTTAQAIIFSVELGIVAIVAVPILAQQWLKTGRNRVQPSEFVRIFGPVYLVVLAVLWEVRYPNISVRSTE